MTFAIVSCMAVGLCFVPFILLGWKKMRQVSAYCVVGIYWLLNGLINLPAQLSLPFNADRHLFGRLNHYYTLAETPLVLLLFAFASRGGKRKLLLAVLLLFVGGESMLVGWKGYTLSTSKVIVWAGLWSILAYSIAELIQYVKKMEHTRFETSMVFVYAALLFAYGSYLIIYIFAHLHPDSGGNGIADSYLLYYISLLLSATVTSTGLWSYGLRRSPVL